MSLKCFEVHICLLIQSLAELLGSQRPSLVASTSNAESHDESCKQRPHSPVEYFYSFPSIVLSCTDCHKSYSYFTRILELYICI